MDANSSILRKAGAAFSSVEDKQDNDHPPCPQKVRHAQKTSENISASIIFSQVWYYYFNTIPSNDTIPFCLNSNMAVWWYCHFITISFIYFIYFVSSLHTRKIMYTVIIKEMVMKGSVFYRWATTLFYHLTTT